MSYRRYGRKVLNSAIGTGVGMAMRGVKNLIWRKTSSPFATKKYVSRISRKLHRLERGYNKELKTHDVAEDTLNPVTTPYVLPLTLISQGDTSLTREGLQIKPRHLQFKFLLNRSADSTIATVVRLILFADREQQGTVPAVADILESSAWSAWTEHDTRPRFKIYRDWTIPLQGTLSLPDSNNNQLYKGIIKFGKKAKIWFSGTGLTQASQGKNSLYLLMLSNETTNYPVLSWYSRLRFTE